MTVCAQNQRIQAPEPQPRAQGTVTLSSKMSGENSAIDRFRTSGSTKVLFPRGDDGLLATLINTSGGLTAGDRFTAQLSAGAGSTLELTTQAAERAYRAEGGVAKVSTELQVASQARLNWLPQELIVFDGAALGRHLRADLAPDARLLLVEPMIFGRRAMGELNICGTVSDRIEIWRGGQPLYIDAVRLSGNISAQLDRPALGAGLAAMASVVYVGPEAETLRTRCARLLPDTAGASLLAPDLLVLRLLGADGYALRQTLVPILEIQKGAALPRPWSL